MHVDRLQQFGAQVVRQRQEAGLERALGSLKDALAARSTSSVAHISLGHLCDEVEVKFRWGQAQLRASRGATTVQTLVQRVFVGCYLSDGAHDVGVHLAETLDHNAPRGDDHISSGISPGLHSFWPGAIGFYNGGRPEAVDGIIDDRTLHADLRRGVRKHGDSPGLGAPLGANILTDPEIGGRSLIWPDSCTAHLHHRATLQVNDLRGHIMRQFAIAKLMCLREIHSQVFLRLEDIHGDSLRRKVGPPPAHDGVCVAATCDSRWVQHTTTEQSVNAHRHGDLLRLVGGRGRDDLLLLEC